MSLPGFTAEMSLYKSAKGYAVTPNPIAIRRDAVVPAQRPMEVPSTVYVPTSGVVFLTKKVCWEKTTSTSKFWHLTIKKECELCQWFRQQRICPEPPGCFTGWVPASEPYHECHSSLVGID